ncbi:hypothetical protein [Erythrobacter westpacificensis]|uniref:hypothetical protein n=1 Tax=Erythrobacter westpacificensis TaxID=1055231 RepID=UPI0031F9821D
MITIVGQSPLSMGATAILYRDGPSVHGESTIARSQPRYSFNENASTGTMLLDSIVCDEKWTEFVSTWCDGAVSVDLVGVIDPILGTWLEVGKVNFAEPSHLALYLSWF